MDRRDSPTRSAGLAWPSADRLTEVIEGAEGGRMAATAVEDAVLVSAAAGLAQLSEFDLFRAAWRHWHGSPADEQRMEPVFACYLHDRKIPGWVRSFARQVVRGADDGSLDPAKLGLEGYRRCEPLPDLSCRFTAEALACALLAMIVILI